MTAMDLLWFHFIILKIAVIFSCFVLFFMRLIIKTLLPFWLTHYLLIFFGVFIHFYSSIQQTLRVFLGCGYCGELDVAFAMDEMSIASQSTLEGWIDSQEKGEEWK